MNTDTPLNAPQPDTADIDAALERQKQYTRKLHAEVPRTIPAEKPDNPLHQSQEATNWVQLAIERGEAIAIWRSAYTKALGEREAYKAHAEKLAEALREFDFSFTDPATGDFQESLNRFVKAKRKARLALSAYESDKQ